MNKNIKVIKVLGRAKRANLDGLTIEREDEIFVPSYHQWFETLNTYDHFCFRQKHKMGATLLCSCGSDAAIFNYEAYRRFDSTYRGQIIACTSLIQYGKHADGSSS